MTQKEFSKLKKGSLLAINYRSGRKTLHTYEGTGLRDLDGKKYYLHYNELIEPKYISLATMDDVVKVVEREEERVKNFKSKLLAALAINEDL